jgi:hypothetical protein
MDFQKYYDLIMESESIEYVEYPQIHKNGYSIKGIYPWQNFKLGKLYSDGDVLLYIHSQHNEFEDDDRVDGVYRLQLVDPNIFSESEWAFDEDHAEEMSKSAKQYPPIVYNTDGDVVDGNHRIAAAKLRGDSDILAFIQQ